MLTGAIPLADRPAHFALAKELLHTRAQERSDLPDGYALRLGSDAFEAVARFVLNESRCCPFIALR
jgi:hypothetical protein